MATSPTEDDDIIVNHNHVPMSPSSTIPPKVPYGQVSRLPKPLPPCPPRPLPATPTEFHQKPLPLPPHSEFPAEMARVFPPTLRTGQVVGIGERRSDPLPRQKQLPPDVQAMQDRFQRTHSIGSVQDQACGGAPFGIKLGSIAIRWPMKIKIVLTVRSRKGIT